MPAFERLPRIETSSHELDLQEEAWWNTNAKLIDRIWGLPTLLCSLARKDYLAEIRTLLHEKLGQGKIKIIEIACGSGWPGRLLADERTEVVGIDFSEQQVRIAEEKARAEHAAYCSYRKMNINQMEQLITSGDFDGAFVHCGLHHLSANELRKFSATISGAHSGFALALVEPIYFDQRTFLGKFASRLLAVAYRTLRICSWGRQKPDEHVQAGSAKLFSESDRMNWFLSPKEMPFTRREIESLFSSHFELVEIRPVTLYGLRVAQDLAGLEQNPKVESLAKRWIPFFNRIDRLLISSGYMTYLTSDYLFSMVLLVRK